jgi:cell division protease FtsH
VDTLLKKEKRTIKALLNRNRHLVIALRDALLDRDELIGEQIVDVLERAGGKPKPRARRAVRA